MTQPTAQVDNNAGAAPLPPYSGPKARIAGADFDVKAAKAYGEIGSGLREMLVTALINSNRFSVLERQALGAIMQEQELAVSGAAQQGAGGPQRGKIKTAEIIVTAAVTEFEPNATGGMAGIGGGGGIASGVLGGFLGAAMNKSHMALDLRIVDTSTSEVLASTRVQGRLQRGQVEDRGFEVGMGLRHSDRIATSTAANIQQPSTGLSMKVGLGSSPVRASWTTASSSSWLRPSGGSQSSASRAWEFAPGPRKQVSVPIWPAEIRRCAGEQALFTSRKENVLRSMCMCVGFRNGMQLTTERT